MYRFLGTRMRVCWMKSRGGLAMGSASLLFQTLKTQVSNVPMGKREGMVLTTGLIGMYEER